MPARRKKLLHGNLAQFRAGDRMAAGQQPAYIKRLAAQRHKHPAGLGQ